MAPAAIPDNHQLHVFLFPVMAQSLMIPMVDVARLFAARGLKSTIITTPLNAMSVSKSVERDRLSGLNINVQIIPFPGVEAGLPEGIECLNEITSPEMMPKFFRAMDMVQEPFEKLLEEHRPDFVVADKIEMSTAQIPSHSESSNFVFEMQKKISEFEVNSKGILVNSFYELEPAYAEHYKIVLGRKAWHIGPISFLNEHAADKAQRGKKSAIDEQYFRLFIHLVVRKIKKVDEDRFLPTGFEERVKGRGLIIRDWAPQLLILDHQAVGGFMTHCGWNSLLESISAGVLMITWPMFTDQFYNEIFITQVIKIGTLLGPKEHNWLDSKNVSLVKNDKIEMVVSWLMGDGEDAKNMRKRAKEISEMAKKSVEEGGSSYADLTSLIEEMRIYTKK
ncbi:UDP-glucose flavonoid 3-O-glucosyltransferase 7-like [Papaver somniferum]|uniref:UDP-glucose flavonoid 3-O-glucosyltransferase 7-like n=1 Tax=Papaver somniferum TaxID=3469 RepID=UPI000E6F86C8|nr:UDP-glucose flavonoid 3-O-glucosyltransferase 7-like [Papaver somniferum]